MKNKICTLLLSTVGLSSFAQLDNTMKFKIDGNGYYDETVVRMMDGASCSFDPSYDAQKMFSTNANVPSIYSNTSQGLALSVNSVPKAGADTLIPIFALIPADGYYQISFDQMGQFDSDVDILFSDLNGQDHAVQDSVAFDIYLSATQDSANPDIIGWYTIMIEEEGGFSPQLNTPIESEESPLSVQDDVILVESDDVDRIEVYSISGQLVYTFDNNYRSKRLQMASWSTGIYIVRTMVNGKPFAKRVYVQS